MNLLSVDPGLRGCGCALWKNSKLIAATYVSPIKQLTLQDAVDAMAFAVSDSLGATLIQKLVIEFPQTYGGRAAKGDANDLLAIATVVGALQIALGVPTTYVRPREWKGQLKKEVVQARLRNDLSFKELVEEANIVKRNFCYTIKQDGDIGIEKIFPVNSPNVEKVVVKEHSKKKIRRAKLYYMRLPKPA